MIAAVERIRCGGTRRQKILTIRCCILAKKKILLLQRKWINSEMPGSTSGSVSSVARVTAAVKFQLFTASRRPLQTQPLSPQSAASAEKITREHDVWKMTPYFST